MSVMKPGVSSRVPPTAIITPSATSRPGKRPSAIAALKRRQAERPCWRSSIDPSRASAIRIASVGRTPIHCPTWMITYSSAIGTTMKSRTRIGIGRGSLVI